MNTSQETLWRPTIVADKETLENQLQQEIRRAVKDGTLAPGTRLPSSRALAASISVARNTVISAYDQLIAEGYLVSRAGAGTFVNNALPDDMLMLSSNGEPPVPKTKKQPKTKSASSGQPALDAFPTDLWARLSSRIWRTHGQYLMQETDPAGYAPLRQSIADYLNAYRSARISPDQVIIVSGIQQAVHTVITSLLSNSDIIAMEDPGYGGIQRTLDHIGYPTEFIHVDSDGANVPKKAGTKLAIISPSYQYPTATHMPIHRRMEFLAWARNFNGYVLEDDYDSEFRYAGRPSPGLISMDSGERVIYAGSFSKSIFPALRLGYLVAPTNIAQKIIHTRIASASFPSITAQATLAAFMSEGHFARHIRKLNKIHKQRHDRFIALAGTMLTDFITLHPSNIGLSIKASFTPRLSHVADTTVATCFQGAGIGAFGLSACYRDAPSTQGLLIGFASISDEDLTDKLNNVRKRLKAI